MMKCFTIFKDKSSKSGRGRSAPELRSTSKSDNSARNRPTRSAGSASLPRSIPEMYREKEQKLRVFSLSELREATNDFNRMLKLGEGGFGSVYKGKIRHLDGQGDNIVVAIKKLNTAGLQVVLSNPQKIYFLKEKQFLGYLKNHFLLVKIFHLLDGHKWFKGQNFRHKCVAMLKKSNL